MRIKISILIVLSVLLFSCKKENNSEKTIQPTQKIEQETDQHKKHHHEHEAINIVLLNGEKWTVDKPMMQHIQNIKSDVMQFKGNSLKDYQVLADKINKNLELLTSNCTMTGQAHDELHKWLVPFLEMAENFSNSKTIEEAQKNYQTIKSSFDILDKNFK